MYTSPSVLQCARTVTVHQYRFVQEDRLAGSSLVVAEFHDHDQPDQFHFSWSDQTREPRRNRLGLQFTMGRTNSPSRCCCCTRRGQPKPIPIGSGYPPLS